ncbi:phosphoribosyltransferase [Parafilimonas sp.]|uniref:phosphoribosyltransferase n=1 Tax=Parafilimonas sp. TaxID=1969739 RepID=UPI003F7EFFFF
MLFLNRYDAAMKLAQLLEKYKNEEGVILAVPRGGVPIGYYLAKHLGFPLDLLMTKKIGYPGNEEFAIGAVGLEGSIIENKYNIPQYYIEREVNRIRKSLAERYKRFMGGKGPLDIKNKIVIIVDDGIATGKTILVTLKLLRAGNPKKLVVAVPVSSVEAATRISEEADEFISLYTPEPFYGVGGFYKDFSQISDEEVMLLLKELNGGKAA